LRTAPARHLRQKDDGDILPRRRFNRAVERSAAADGDDGIVAFDAVEANGSAVVHRKGHGGTVRRQLGVGDARKRFREVHVAAGKAENGLLGRNGSHKRGKIHAQVAHRTPEFIDIRKSKYLGRLERRESVTRHSVLSWSAMPASECLCLLAVRGNSLTRMESR